SERFLHHQAVHLVRGVGDDAGIEEATLSADLDRSTSAEHTAALCPCFLRLRLELFGRARLRHGTQRRGRIHRIAHAQLADLRDCSLDESVVEGTVYVDALDSAAALAGVVEGAVDEVLDGVL